MSTHLDVVERYPEKFQVCALSAGSNVELFAQQIRKFKPALAALFDITKIDALKELVADLDVEIVSGQEGVWFQSLLFRMQTWLFPEWWEVPDCSQPLRLSERVKTWPSLIKKRLLLPVNWC